MKIVYKKVSGIATDLRFENNSYVLQTEEVDHGTGDILPDINTLHDLSHYKMLKKQEVSKNVRDKIAETYSVTDELELARIGILDNTDVNWITYNTFCDNKRSQGVTIKANIDSASTKSAVDAISLIIT